MSGSTMRVDRRLGKRGLPWSLEIQQYVRTSPWSSVSYRYRLRYRDRAPTSDAGLRTQDHFLGTFAHASSHSSRGIGGGYPLGAWRTGV